MTQLLLAGSRGSSCGNVLTRETRKGHADDAKQSVSAGTGSLGGSRFLGLKGEPVLGTMAEGRGSEVFDRVYALVMASGGTS